jgi:hypothetical protein
VKKWKRKEGLLFRTKWRRFFPSKKNGEDSCEHVCLSKWPVEIRILGLQNRPSFTFFAEGLA